MVLQGFTMVLDPPFSEPRFVLVPWFSDLLPKELRHVHFPAFASAWPTSSRRFRVVQASNVNKHCYNINLHPDYKGR
jgi:hypothetical protein